MANMALQTITPQEWPMVMDQAKMLVTTGFLPQAVKTPEQAIAIMMKGRELQIPPMYALSNIAVIQGKPTCNAELMLALIFRDHGDQAIEFIESTDKQCTIRYKRRNGRDFRTLSYTADQARQAGLSGGNWQKYPSAMLRARCISAVARLAFPDSIGGMYTPEELGASVDVETGEIAPPLQLPEADAETGEIIEPSDPRIEQAGMDVRAELKRLGLRKDDAAKVMTAITDGKFPVDTLTLGELHDALATLVSFKDAGELSAFMDRRNSMPDPERTLELANA